MSEQETTAVAVKQEPKPPMLVGSQGLELNSLDSIWRFSGILAKSGLAPKGLESQEALTIAIQMGLEVGLLPMQAIQNIAVINGRPCIWGDAALALVQSGGTLEWIKEYTSGEWGKDDYTAHCEVKRKGWPDPIKHSFSYADAKRAELPGKSGPWKTYPKRMMQMRARGYALRDGFADRLRGFRVAEEQIGAVDIEATVIEVVDDPPKKKAKAAPKAADFGQDEPAQATTTEQADALPFDV